MAITIPKKCLAAAAALSTAKANQLILPNFVFDTSSTGLKREGGI